MVPAIENSKLANCLSDYIFRRRADDRDAKHNNIKKIFSVVPCKGSDAFLNAIRAVQ
jgi:hypothetical protein